MNLAAELRELRILCGMTQERAAELSGIGVKTISSFETGERVDAIKVVQLMRLLNAYGLTLAEFLRGASPDALPSRARVNCVIVQSEREIDLVSLRPCDVHKGEGGKGGTLKRRLTEAGFRPGQRVAIVAVKEERV
jgi:transcriptional regulator with XRE-family HTH domain